jgi:hypothetical protein
VTTPARIFDLLFVYPFSAAKLAALRVPASLLPIAPAAIVSAVAVLSLISCPLITLDLV